MGMVLNICAYLFMNGRTFTTSVITFFLACLPNASSKLLQKQLWFLKLVYFSGRLCWVISIIDAVKLKSIRFLERRKFISERQTAC
jgi:hypothetical protein